MFHLSVFFFSYEINKFVLMSLSLVKFPFLLSNLFFLNYFLNLNSYLSFSPVMPMEFFNGYLILVSGYTNALIRETWSNDPGIPQGIELGTLEFNGRDASQTPSRSPKLSPLI